MHIKIKFQIKSVKYFNKILQIKFFKKISYLMFQLYDDKKPVRLIENWNVWFYKDINNLVSYIPLLLIFLSDNFLYTYVLKILYYLFFEICILCKIEGLEE